MAKMMDVPGQAFDISSIWISNDGRFEFTFRLSIYLFFSLWQIHNSIQCPVITIFRIPQNRLNRQPD